MKPIVRFQADDGAVFDTAAAAEQHEAWCRRIAAIEAPLGPRVRDSDRRKQHAADVFSAFKIALVLLCREAHPDVKVFQHEPLLEIHPFSYAGRYLDECGPAPIRQAWARLMCMTDDGMEYQQPFFALNPDKWEGETECCATPPVVRRGMRAVKEQL